MDSFDLARRLARSMRDQLAGAGGELDAPSLVRRLAARHDVECLRLDAGDPLLFGARGMLDRQARAIFVAAEEDDAEAAALIAHELGHLLLHERSAPLRDDASRGETAAPGPDPEEARSELCAQEDLDADAGERVGVHCITAYHARERRESEANLFARELVLPAPLARRLFLEGEGAGEMARRLRLPLEIVRRQLCEALLLADGDRQTEENELEGDASSPAPLVLDDSQRRAAEHSGSALLLTAGPGTGKTRTLIGRILHLLGDGVEPSSILALTFSNKAAAEMSERLAEAAPAAAPRLWIGTFHAFALECLRRHHDRLDLDADFRLLDRADAVTLLEQRVAELDFEHFRPADEYSSDLPEMLAAISRAKDERAGAATYTRLVSSWAERAKSAEEKGLAARALDVARLYELYEETLREKKRVDFGDLIHLAARLLEQNAAVRAEVRLRHRHVLVDEYQDTNRASRDLLKALAGRGERLWVVGDPRQSIYRFRGASMSQIASFADDFPGAVRRRLDVCYRSTGSILETFEAFGRSMQVDGPASAAESEPEGESPRAQRECGSAPRLIEAEDPGGEIAAVAAEVERLRRQGAPLRQQAILCRTHSQLEAAARGLASRGLAVLHLGRFFERDEVRDLLSLLSLVVDPAGGALMRLATLPGYDVPLQDVHGFLRWLAERELPARAGLEKVAASTSGDVDLPLLSAAGTAGLARLHSHLEKLDARSSPWQILATYLFDEAEWPRRLMRGERRLEAAAIYQCLAFVRAGIAGGRGWPARRLLDRVRRLALLGEERHLRQMPSESLDIDALRLLTLHGAKGLEFDAVHLPGWVRGQLPHRFRTPRCPLPPGLIDAKDGDDGGPEDDVERRAHEADEACLAFVGLSRARHDLRLYRHSTAGGRRHRPSPFLDALMPHLEAEQSTASPLPAGDGGSIDIEAPPVVFGEGDVGLYEGCPRRFFYSRLFDLPGSRRRGPVAERRRVLYRAIDQLREQPRMGAEALRRQVEQAMGGAGATRDKTLERILTGPELDRLLQLAAGASNAAPKEVAGETPLLSLPIGDTGAVFETRPVLADREHGKDGMLELLFIRPGSSRFFSPRDASLGLIQEAARRRYGTGGARLEMLFLGDGEHLTILLPQKQASEHVERAEAVADAVAERRFPAAPDVRRCPRCPYFFLCPALPSGDLRLPAPRAGEQPDGV